VTTDQTASTVPVTAETIQEGLLGFLGSRTKTVLTADQDLFASGLVSSLFAMELVVHLENAYGLDIVGADLKLNNFRTVQIMSSLVLRLRAAPAVAGSA
jgi:methoxymalonate biosynthesis acyl carrier protein